MTLLMTMMRTGKIVGGVLICHRMDTVEMKAFHMMENRGRCGCGEGYSWDDNDGKVKRRWSEWDYLRKRQLQRHMIKKIRNR